MCLVHRRLHRSLQDLVRVLKDPFMLGHGKLPLRCGFQGQREIVTWPVHPKGLLSCWVVCLRGSAAKGRPSLRVPVSSRPYGHVWPRSCVEGLLILILVPCIDLFIFFAWPSLRLRPFLEFLQSPARGQGPKDPAARCRELHVQSWKEST